MAKKKNQDPNVNDHDPNAADQDPNINDQDPNAADQDPAAENTVELVAMTRELEGGQKGPTTADVHPDMVDDYAAHGWQKK